MGTVLDGIVADGALNETLARDAAAAVTTCATFVPLRGEP